MPEYYECHVTLPPEYKSRVEPIAKQHKFKTSVLKGDEVMGDDALLYCTSHGKTFEGLRDRMERMIKDLPVDPLRKKIEHVVLDVRHPVGEMELGLWHFDPSGYIPGEPPDWNLVYREGKGTPQLTGLTFDTEKDAKWAVRVFAQFIRG